MVSARSPATVAAWGDLNLVRPTPVLGEKLPSSRDGLNINLNQAVFDDDFVGLDGLARAVEAVAGADVEAPAVPVAGDGVAEERAVGEGRAFVRAEVFDAVEVASDVVEREFPAAFELDGRAAPFGNVFDAPDGDELAFAPRSSEV